MPFTAPSVPLFAIVYSLMNIVVTPATTVPLNQDYIEKQSLGKASSLSLVGMNIGSVLGLQGVLNLIKDLDYKMSFGLCGGAIVIWAICTLFLVIEPPDL